MATVPVTRRLSRAARANRAAIVAASPKKTPGDLLDGVRLFAIVIVNNDGSEVLHKPIIVPAVSAAQTVGGLISSLAHTGAMAEAREIDTTALQFTGRLLGASDLRAAVGKAVR